MKLQIYTKYDIEIMTKKAQKLIREISKNKKLKFIIFDNQSIFNNKKG